MKEVCRCALIKYRVRWCKVPYHNKSCNSFNGATVTLVTIVLWWKLCDGVTVNLTVILIFLLSLLQLRPLIAIPPGTSPIPSVSLSLCAVHTVIGRIRQTSALVCWPTVFACSAEIQTSPLRNLTISLNDSNDRTNQFHNEAKTTHCGINRVCIDPKLSACSTVHFCCVVVCSV